MGELRPPLPGPPAAGELSGAGGSSVFQVVLLPNLQVKLAMQCLKCDHTNSKTAQFCTRCHTPLRYTCPACKYVQTHSGKCDKCGVDFAKYAGVLMFQTQMKAGREHEGFQRRTSLLKQILLLPFTWGFSLLRYFFSKGRDR